MPSRRHVLLGLAGAIGWSEATQASDKSRKRKKKAVKRVNWCYSHTEEAVGCDQLPSTTCRGYVALAQARCCAKAKSGWGAFNRCLNA